MKWWLEGYFLCLPMQQSPEKCTDIWEVFWAISNLFSKGGEFSFQNARIDRGMCLAVWKEVIKIKEKIPIITYSHYRRARKLVRQCCNYDGGNCLTLDNGEECICVQSISYSLLCRWFRAAVLPLEVPLATALLHRKEHKQCAVCGQPFLPGSNRAKYCKACATIVHRRQKTLSDRKRRAACGQLEE